MCWLFSPLYLLNLGQQCLQLYKDRGDIWGDNGREGCSWDETTTEATSTSAAGSVGPSAGFPSRMAGHCDSAGAEACDQRESHLYPGKGGSGGEQRSLPSEEEMCALLLPAYNVAKNHFPSSVKQSLGLGC